MAKTDHYYGLILAGGRGTRFWPKSRKKSAKQVLSFFGERTLIQQTVDRLRAVLPPERIWIITNDHLRDTIAKQLPEVPKKQIIAEPAQRNTAPAIGLIAQILHRQDPDAVMGVFPADHVIEKNSRYVRLVKPAFKAAAEGKIAVLGVQPRWAETGYGYIEFPPGVTAGEMVPVPVRSFREKPDLETAKEYVAAGNFYWNAGMFFWRADVVLGSLREHLPHTASTLESLPAFGSAKFKSALATKFLECESISIDYAVLEKATNIVGIPAEEFGWNDVGTWNAVYELGARGIYSNVSRGEVIAELATGNYVDVPGKLVALLGVENLVIVETPDALLIADRNRSQQVSDIVKALEKMKREELL